MLQNGIFRLDWTATDPCCKLITIKQSGWPRNQFVYNVYKVVENNTQKLNSLLAIQWIKNIHREIFPLNLAWQLWQLGVYKV